MEEEKSQPKPIGKLRSTISKVLKAKIFIYTAVTILTISIIGVLLYILESNGLLSYTIFPTANNDKQEEEIEETPEEETEEPTEEYTEEEDIEYETGKISKQSTGLLYLIEEISYDDSSNSEVYLLFKDTINNRYINISGNLYEKPQEGDPSIGSYPFSPILINDEIYFLFGHRDPLEENLLKKINIYTGVVTNIPLQQETSKYIHAYHIEDQTVYYLTGADCSTYTPGPSGCNLELKSYNMTTGKTEILGQNFISRDILGFDSTKTKLITVFGDGDAGCVWVSLEQYNIVTKTKSTLGSYDYCYNLETNELETEEDEQQLEGYLAIYNSVEGIGTGQYIKLSEGKFSLPTESEEEQNYISGRMPIRLKQ